MHALDENSRNSSSGPTSAEDSLQQAVRGPPPADSPRRAGGPRSAPAPVAAPPRLAKKPSLLKRLSGSVRSLGSKKRVLFTDGNPPAPAPAPTPVQMPTEETSLKPLVLPSRQSKVYKEHVGDEWSDSGAGALPPQGRENACVAASHYASPHNTRSNPMLDKNPIRTSPNPCEAH